MGFGSITGPMCLENRKPRWLWRATGPKAVTLLSEKIGSYLCSRRAFKLHELLAFESCLDANGKRTYTPEGLQSLREADARRQKLSGEDVLYIRESNLSTRELSEEFSVSRSHIRNIRSGLRPRLHSKS